MGEYLVEELTEQPLQAMVEILSAAYVDNGLHLAAFPGEEGDRLTQNRALFGLAMGMLGGTWLCVRAGSDLVGVLRYAPSPGCIPPPEAQGELGQVFAANLGEAGVRVAEWFKSWSDVHPGGKHWHLGPFAVAPEYQGRGIGSLLMEEYCRRMDQAQEVGYLETDKPRNIRFYEKFGFEVTRQEQVIGATNWFMERMARVAG